MSLAATAPATLRSRCSGSVPLLSVSGSLRRAPGLDSHLLSIAPAWRTSHGPTARSFLAPCRTSASLHLVTILWGAVLSNIVLDELDQELERRGHRFVRYADDCNVYVRTQRAGQRVMASLRRFIERRLRLKVNETKSAVARPEERHFVGFRLRREPLDGHVEVLLSKRSKERIDQRLRELVPRNWGGTLDACISRLNVYLAGWISFFGVCTEGAARVFQMLDAHIRRRLRALQLSHWKRKRTILRNLVSRGIRRSTAWRTVYGGRKSTWALSHTPAVDLALRNSHWDARGLFSVGLRWRQMHAPIVAPTQLPLGLG